MAFVRFKHIMQTLESSATSPFSEMTLRIRHRKRGEEVEGSTTGASRLRVFVRWYMRVFISRPPSLFGSISGQNSSARAASVGRAKCRSEVVGWRPLAPAPPLRPVGRRCPGLVPPRHCPGAAPLPRSRIQAGGVHFEPGVAVRQRCTTGDRRLMLLTNRSSADDLMTAR